MSVDEQLHYGLHVVGVDECLLLLLRRDERHPADGHQVPAPTALPPTHLAEAGVAGRAELLDAEVLGLGLELQDFPPRVRERDLAVTQEVQDGAEMFSISVCK